MENPKVSVWITSTGRFEYTMTTIESFIKECTYPNYEFIIIHSQMTPESLTFFDTTQIDAEKTEQYLQELPSKYPNIKFNIIIQPWKKLGVVYNQLLANTLSRYFVSLEDDGITVADPAPQFRDNIQLLSNDPHLLGIRIDLRDATVYEGSPRFQGTKEVEGIKFVYWDTCSGGAQLMDTVKVRELGGYLENHPAINYGDPEADLERKMRQAKKYIGINLSYYGFWAHMASKSCRGIDKNTSSNAYKHLIEKGWYGDGHNKQPLDDK